MKVRLPELTDRGRVRQRQQALVDKVTAGLQSVGRKPVDVSEADSVIPAGKPSKATDMAHDGAIVGAEGLFSPLTPLDVVKPVLPDNGAAVTASVILVNGVMTDVALQRADMQGLANTGCAVVGVHNSTEGMVNDLIECVLNKLDTGDTPAIDTLARLIARALEDEAPVRVIGHSQGGLIVARALQIVAEALAAAGLPAAAVKDVLSRVSVETYGAASMNYVDGPRYVHVLNKADLIPVLSGVGLDMFNPFGNAGEGATIKAFVEMNAARELPPLSEGLDERLARFVDRTVHGPRDVYWKHRKG